ncbi:MAG TPA: cyclase family protein [Acidimicrobiales bacterium]|nr:cyclase family protein [Acidimicrobiales bacterium]
MRDVPDGKLKAWSPPQYEVDANGKVVGAVPGEPNNWGRWGDDDQRGCVNLLTPERIAAAATLARTGKRISLGLPIGGPTKMPGYRPPPLHLFGETTGDFVLGDGRLQYSDDYVVLALQATTQLDGFGHVAGGDLLYNGFWAGLITASSGARRLGIHHLADGIVGRAVLLDLAVGGPLPGGHAIEADELERVAAAQGVEIGPGDILLIRTGHLGWLLEGNNETAGAPGLTYRALPWLHERDVAMVALDNVAAEVLPPEGPLPFHVGAIRDLGMMIGELFDLDALAADCAADGVYEMFFTAPPLPVVNGVGSPLNPICIK